MSSMMKFFSFGLLGKKKKKDKDEESRPLTPPETPLFSPPHENEALAHRTVLGG